MVIVAPSETRTAAAPLPPEPSRARLAARDLAEGLAKSWMWTALALEDIRLRYRGSMLGPFWLTISTVVMAAGMGLVYSQVFRVQTESYVPYLTVGLILWQLIASLINEGCEVFVRAESVIQQVPIAFSIHVYRSVCRNVIILAHSLIVIPPMLLLFGIRVDWHVLEIIPGLALLIANGVWITLLLGVFGTRFRDISPIVGNFMQVLFFLTPIIYPIEALREWRGIATWNPFFAAIDVVRAPLLGTVPEGSSWVILVLWTLVGSALAFALFARFRGRIAYWI